MSQISSLMAAAEGPVAKLSRFANFEEKKRNLLISFLKIVNQMGSFGLVKKEKKCFVLLLADSQLLFLDLRS